MQKAINRATIEERLEKIKTTKEEKLSAIEEKKSLIIKKEGLLVELKKKKAKAEEQRMNLSALRFKQFAHSYNKKFNGSGLISCPFSFYIVHLRGKKYCKLILQLYTF